MNKNGIIIGIVIFFLLVLFFRSRTTTPSISPPTQPPIYCNNRGFIDQNGVCQCDEPWYGENCQFSQSVEGINMSSIYKTVLFELSRLKNKSIEDVKIFGKAGDYYITRASGVPGQKTSIGSSVGNLSECLDKSSSEKASFFTYHPQTKVCEYYSQPSTMSLTNLTTGNMIVGCKRI